MDFLHSYFLHVCLRSQRHLNLATQDIHPQLSRTKIKYLLFEILSSPIVAHSNSHTTAQTVYCKSRTFEGISDHSLDHPLRRSQNSWADLELDYYKEYNLLNSE